MKNNLRLYCRYLSLSIKSQMQYKLSFILDTMGQFLVVFIEFIGLAALFQRFGHLLGWSLPEAAILYGQVNIAFSIADMLGRGFDLFGNLVRQGEFDRILLRPRGTILQLLAYEFTLKRIGRILQGLFVLLWGTFNLGMIWNLPKLILLLSSMTGTCLLFLGLFIIQASLAFRTVETLEIMNTMTYGGTYAAQYPLSIYKRELRIFFTFIVPLAGVNYFPMLSLLEKQDALGTPLWLGYVTPLCGLLFFLVSVVIWRIGVLHYQSSGS